MDPLEIDGQEPPIVGEICEELVAIEYSHAGEVVDPANVVFLRFAGHWHQLYFDCGIIYWRSDDDAPQSFDAEEIDATYRALDLATPRDLRSRRLQSVDCEPLPRGSAVRLSFEGGRTITFRSIDDTTRY